MKFYVAGKYAERETVRKVFEHIRKAGHEVTVDWTTHDFEPGSDSVRKLREYALEDIEGVRRCNVLVAIMLEPHEYKGLWVEVGVAAGFGKPVIVVGHAGDSCIFLNLPLVWRMETLEDFYRELEDLNNGNGNSKVSEVPREDVRGRRGEVLS